MSDIEASDADELEQHGQRAADDVAAGDVAVGLEEPEADVVEQHAELDSAGETAAPTRGPDVTAEADEADLVEGSRPAGFDDEDYR